MTDDTASGGSRASGAERRPPEQTPPGAWSRSDPMAVPTTAPLWTYEQHFDLPTTTSESAATATDEPATGGGRRRRGPGLGILAVLLAVSAAAVEIAGIGESAAGNFAAGTVLAIVAIVASAAAVVVGLIALIIGAGRVPAAVGTLLGVLVNPLVLLTVLTLVAGAASVD